ncbi:MAG: hypothetical protein ACJ0BU_01180 [Candidatus Puniceispirillales bacterium]
MFNLFLGIILFIGLITATILSVDSVGIFMDMPSLIIVVLGALIYSFSAGGDTIDRLDNFGFGAVRMGWIGFIIGIVLMANRKMILDMELFSSAFAVAMLPIFYGYLFQIITNMIVYRLEINKFDDELKEED